MNYYYTLTQNYCGVYGRPMCQHIPVTKTSIRPVYLTSNQ